MPQDDSVTSSNSISKVDDYSDTALTDTMIKIDWSVITSERLSRRDKILRMLPPLIRGEAKSSWLYRVAVLYGVSPCELANQIKIYANSGALDFSNWYEIDYKNSRVWLIGSHDRPTGLLGLTKNRDFSPVHRFCPRCLEEDQIPRFRWYWSLASSVCCQRHFAVLLERCPDCNARIRLSDGIADHFSFVDRERALRCCPKCCASLTSEKSTPVPRSLLQTLMTFQRLVEEIAINDSYQPSVLIPLELTGSPLSPCLRDEHGAQIKDDANLNSLLGRVQVDWEMVVGRPHYGQFLEWVDGFLEL